MVSARHSWSRCTLPGPDPDTPTWESLPADFLFGTTSAAFRTEGAADVGGRTPSVWDVLAAVDGRVVDGSTGPQRVDHFHRYTEDIDLLARLQVGAHSFSISWSRVLAGGTGSAGHAASADRGLDFYDRLVDGLLQRGIAPWATLYHWDLPAEQMLEGGWLVRDTAERFGAYAALVAARLGDRVAAWVTMADPFLHMAYGHAAGVDAPGLTLLDGAFAVTHHLLLGHARAREALRAAGSAPVGIANSHTEVFPASDSPENRLASAFYDSYHNLQFAEPLLRGRYPRLLEPLVQKHPGLVRPGDLSAISAPLEFYGVDYQHPTVVAAATGNATVPFSLVDWSGVASTGAGRPIRPESLTAVLWRLKRQFPMIPALYVTENGAAFADENDDADRREYLRSHLAAVAAAAKGGLDVRGYFFRSLTDGWEGTEGFTEQYGLVAVDRATGGRIPRASFEDYRQLIAAHRGRAQTVRGAPPPSPGSTSRAPHSRGSRERR